MMLHLNAQDFLLVTRATQKICCIDKFDLSLTELQAQRLIYVKLIGQFNYGDMACIACMCLNYLAES